MRTRVNKALLERASSICIGTRVTWDLDRSAVGTVTEVIEAPMSEHLDVRSFEDDGRRELYGYFRVLWDKSPFDLANRRAWCGRHLTPIRGSKMR